MAARLVTLRFFGGTMQEAARDMHWEVKRLEEALDEGTFRNDDNEPPAHVIFKQEGALSKPIHNRMPVILSPFRGLCSLGSCAASCDNSSSPLRTRPCHFV